MTAHCDEIRLSLGSYVLGSLDAEETEQVRSHLTSCVMCQVEHADLAGLPGLMAGLTEEEFAADPSPVTPSAGLLDRMLRQAAAEQDREVAIIAAAQAERDELAAARGQRVRPARRERTGGRAVRDAAERMFGQPAAVRRPSWGLRLVSAAAGLVLVFVAGGVGWRVGLQQGQSGGVQAVAASQTFAASDPASGVSARVTATPTTWGNALSVWFTGVPKGTWCHMVAVGQQGRQEIASSWRADYGDQPQDKGEAVIPGAVGMSLDQITRFDIVTAEGQPLVSIPA